jgi:predicted glycogen debranching enzyme
LDEQQCRNLDISARREWLLTNGIGGYAMGTVSGINTRRYHGQLVAATTPPTGRMVLLAAVDASISSDGHPVGLSANQYSGVVHPEGYHYLKHFSVSDRAIWRYRAAGMELEKSLYLHKNANKVTFHYSNVGDTTFHLALRPLISHKNHHGNFSEHAGYPEHIGWEANSTRIRQHNIELVLSHNGAQREPVHGWYYRFEHSREIDRGLDPRDDLYCPCELGYDLAPGESAWLTASCGESQEGSLEAPSEEASDPRLSTMLRDAAGKFFVETTGRSSIIAGFPWFTDWGRDTMISIPGLCLHTGRWELATEILRDYASQMWQGLVPNRFVEVGEQPDYNTVDATLWFVHAVHRVLDSKWDEDFAREAAGWLHEIFEWHTKGTAFGIGVDPSDGLLTQGVTGAQLTWMDAKVGDWVVTPRHGKPVEINGLWINGLRVMKWLAKRLNQPADAFDQAAEKAESHFEVKFWHPMRGHYMDTADPMDASLRPNQVIAMALPFTPVNPEHARLALGVVSRELLTPVGLRTLGPEEPGYQGSFRGSLPELDAAYHQGTVWPWLLGPYVSALVRFTGDRQEGKRVLREARRMLTEYGIGGIAEVYDGDEPQSPGGCPWQAWSCAEILRAWVEDCQGD